MAIASSSTAAPVPTTTGLTPRAELRASLERHNAAFTTLLELIPAQFYIQPTQEEADSKWLKNKKRKTGEEIKEHKRKNLADKLDPSNQKTSADILFAADPSFAGADADASASAPADGEPSSKKAKTKSKAETNGSGPANANANANADAPAPTLPLAQLPPSKSISDLRARLADKLASFKARRGAGAPTGSNDVPVGVRAGARSGQENDEDGSDGDGDGDADEDMSDEDDDDGDARSNGTSGTGTASRGDLEAESRRRRGEMRDKRRRDRKAARRAEAEGQGKGQGKGKAAEGKGKGKEGMVKKEDRNMPTAKTQLIVPQHPHSHSDGLTLPPVALPSGKSKTPSKHANPNATGSSGVGGSSSSSGGGSTFKHLSNPAHALAQLQKHDRNLAGMDADKQAAAREAERWAKALHRAEGGKVVDSEKVLKKAVKRVEKTKSKSGKEWVERKKQLADAQAVAIKKRNDNIASRHQARKDKKMGIKKKDKDPATRKGGPSGQGSRGRGGPGGAGGKGRPGFEGKKGGAGGGAGKGKGAGGAGGAGGQGQKGKGGSGGGGKGR